MKFSYTNTKGPLLCSGDIADLYLGSINRTDKKQILIKTAREDYDRDLIYQEFKALGFLGAHLNDTYRQCIPQVFDHDNCTNYLETFSGFISAEDIHALAPALHPRTLVWMWKRILGLLGWVHSLGWVHGAILPPHVLFYPDNNMRGGRDVRKHSLRLVDWCYATEYEHYGKLAAWVPRFKDFYPVEVDLKRDLGPWTDIYMAAKVIEYLAGSRVINSRRLTDFLPKELMTVWRKSTNITLDGRYKLAAEAFHDLKKAAEVAFGEPKFHRFILPL